MLVAILVALLQGPSPSPSPATQATDHLRVIVTVKSTAFCTAFRKMAVPIGFIAERDDTAFSYLAGLVKIGTPIPTRDWSPLTMAIAQRETSYQVAQNLVLADNVMNTSWQSYPRGVDANIDTLRQRLQNIIDLQRAIDSAYLAIGFGTENCQTSDMEDASKDRPCRARSGFVSGQLRQGDAAAEKTQQGMSDPEVLPVANAHDVAHFGSIAAIKYQLDLQEFALAKELQTAAVVCGA